MATKTKTLALTQKNLEASGWLFSTSLGIMVAEHELGNGKWDIEVDYYVPVGKDRSIEKGVWNHDTNVVYDSYKTVAEVIAANSEFGTTRDWVHGDSVTFW